jgi:hypothetical protein
MLPAITPLYECRFHITCLFIAGVFVQFSRGIAMRNIGDQGDYLIAQIVHVSLAMIFNGRAAAGVRFADCAFAMRQVLGAESA